MKYYLFIMTFSFLFSCAKNKKKEKVKDVNYAIEEQDSSILNQDGFQNYTISSSHYNDTIVKGEDLFRVIYYFEKDIDTLADKKFLIDHRFDIKFGYRYIKGEVVGDTLRFHFDKSKLELIKGEFNKDDYQIQYNGDYVDLINGKQPTGVDGNLPREIIKSIIWNNGGKKIELPETIFEDLYEPNFYLSSLYLRDAKEIILEMSGSDGAGGYLLTLFIKDSGKTDRIISVQ